MKKKKLKKVELNAKKLMDKKVSEDCQHVEYLLFFFFLFTVSFYFILYILTKNPFSHSILYERLKKL